MIPSLIAIAIVVGLPLVYMLAQYNALVALKNYIRESWSDVDVELKRRYDLIPNLVATVNVGSNATTQLTATGITDQVHLDLIEDVMRNDIFHSTLDWQTRKQLENAARQALSVLPELLKQGAKL